jgi:hypothetical protein
MKIVASLATRYQKPASTVRPFVPLQLEQWGRVQILSGGDLLRAHGMVEIGVNGRDATFVRVSAASLYSHISNILICV